MRGNSDFNILKDNVEKITIKKSQSADTRSATEKVSKEQLLSASHQHINDVRKAINWMRNKLGYISEKHDFTKIDYIDDFYNEFEQAQNDPDFNFKESSWFRKHITSERHHVNDYCCSDINLFDLLERVADITMAGMARTGEIYDDELSPKILMKAYKNTVELLKKNIEVED